MKKLALLAGLVSLVVTVVGCGDSSPGVAPAAAGATKEAPMKKAGMKGMSSADLSVPNGGQKDPFGTKAKSGG